MSEFQTRKQTEARGATPIAKTDWTLVVRRVGLSFLRAFLAVFIPGLIGLLTVVGEGVTDEDFDVSTSGWLLVALVVASIVAGLRALQGFLTDWEGSEAKTT